MQEAADRRLPAFRECGKSGPLIRPCGAPSPAGGRRVASRACCVWNLSARKREEGRIRTPLPRAGEGEARSAEGEGGLFLQTPQSFRASFPSTTTRTDQAHARRRKNRIRPPVAAGHDRRRAIALAPSAQSRLDGLQIPPPARGRRICRRFRLPGTPARSRAHAGNARDEARDRVLQDMGFRVLRFWDNAALVDQQAVLAAILAALDGSLPAAAGEADKGRNT